jgi:hypothetical protein
MALVIAADPAPERPARVVLEEALTWVHAAESSAEQDSRVGERLSELAPEVLAVAAEWIESTRDHDPMLAWSILYVLDRFVVPDAAELFHREAVRRVRFDENGGCQQHGNIDQLVGVQASEALSRRVVAGEERALDMLFDVVSAQECAAIRVAAALALRGAAPGHEGALAKMLGDRAEVLNWRQAEADDMVISGDAVPPLDRHGLPPSDDRPQLKGVNHG